mmetsp:Transcript_43025/g.101171  ORF Transcript_43025/g.101171 Transcript_43025/m.101171 type:complete len:478 (-) Transcript_43025:253-1686(-)
MPPCSQEIKTPKGVNIKVTAKPVITLDELKTHNTKNSLWISIDDKVYDLTKWAAHHPGGEHLLHNLGGQDASAVYHAFHTSHGSGIKAEKILRNLSHVATLAPHTESKLEVDFRELREKIERDGMYDTSWTFYLGLALWLSTILASAIYLTVTADSFGSTLLAAFVYALFLQQCAFVGHDTAHNGITHDRKTDILIGIVVGPLLTGISTSWWKRSHNAHHVVTNSVMYDPDIQHMPVFAITDEQFKNGGTYSKYHNKIFHFDAAAKFLISYQHYLFYPIMAFARWNLYVQSWLLLLNFDVVVDMRSTEIGAMIFYPLSLAYLASHLPSASLVFTFLIVSHMLAGILHVQICISHFTMPTYSGASFEGAPAGEHFIRQQLHTSMDLDSGWWNDWFYGGLQWQVVHHIFPRVPRHNLPIVKEQLQALCKEHGLVYKSVGWWAGNAEIVNVLYDTAMKARQSKMVNFEESMIWQAMQAEG